MRNQARVVPRDSEPRDRISMSSLPVFIKISAFLAAQTSRLRFVVVDYECEVPKTQVYVSRMHTKITKTLQEMQPCS